MKKSKFGNQIPIYQKTIGLITIFIILVQLFLIFFPNTNVTAVLMPASDTRTSVSVDSSLLQVLELPDLVVTDIWLEEDLIYYQLQNIGNSTATTLSGHYTFLFIDGANITDSWVEVDLEPRERWKGFFDFPWTCTELEDHIEVFVDFFDNVEESNETNNGREEIWKSDTTIPNIVEGPTVDNITSNSALIRWTTDEECSSIVKYGKTALHTNEKTEANQTREHAILLTRLELGTTYHFVVQSTDSSKNMVESKEKTFETSFLTDDVDPEVSFVDLDELSDFTIISCEASDNIGVEKVEFYLDGKLLFTDYSPPYEMPLESTKYPNGEYELASKVYDYSGKSTTDIQKCNIVNQKDEKNPTVEITSHTFNDHVSGEVNVEATLTDDLGLMQARFYVDGKWAGIKSFDQINPPTSTDVTFVWDSTTIEPGIHSIAIEAYDNEINVGWHTVKVFVDPFVPEPLPIPPRLTVFDHRVYRQDNKIKVEFSVRNDGDLPAIDIWIQNAFFKGFQPISSEDSQAEYQLVWFHPTEYTGMLNISCKQPISAGQELTFTFDAVPVLIHPDLATRELGDHFSIKWRNTTSFEYHDFFTLPVLITEEGETIFNAYQNAVKAADYLIVTSPVRLLGFFSPSYYNTPNQEDDPLNELLSTMAKLAFYKQGVLGYITSNADTFRNLIRVGGSWSDQLIDNWVSEGYLLIVGEAEIFPSYTFTWTHTFYKDYKIVLCDHPYADTGWEQEIPDISVGRIIGNTVERMTNTINVSLGVYLGWNGYHCDYSDALLASGVNPNADKYEGFIDSLSKFLVKEGFGVWPLKAREETDMNQAFKDTLRWAQDIVIHRDHGYPTGWNGIISTLDFPLDLGEKLKGFNTNPVVLSLSCQSGNYETYAGYTGEDSIAEAWLANNASIYIGSTINSPTDANNQGGLIFFQLFCDGSASSIWQMKAPNNFIGTILKITKQCMTLYGYTRKVWATEYNLYGDPKFEAGKGGSILSNVESISFNSLVNSSKSHLVPVAENQNVIIVNEKETYNLGIQHKQSTIDVVVPDYEVTVMNGKDYVQIPNGDVMDELDKPLVPLYGVFLEYPKGSEIQDVILTNRSGLVTMTGLDIPNAKEEWDLTNNVTLGESFVDWWPKEAFTWDVIENPDGGIYLVITLFPFYYNPLTTDVKFYKNFSFDIDYTVSQVDVVKLSSSDVYSQGETVAFDVLLNNSGEPQDIIVSALIMRCGADEKVVDGIPLSTLHDLRGKASFSAEWNSSGTDSGYYFIELTIKDIHGNVLDVRNERFRLGISSGETTSLTVTPEQFEIGEDVEINSQFRNTGTTNISGVAVTKIRDSTGKSIMEFRHNITDLAPSETKRFTNIWDTSEAIEGSYNIISYVHYDSQTTFPANATIFTHPQTTDEDKEGGAFPIWILWLIAVVIVIAIVIIAILRRRK